MNNEKKVCADFHDEGSKVIHMHEFFILTVTGALNIV